MMIVVMARQIMEKISNVDRPDFEEDFEERSSNLDLEE